MFHTQRWYLMTDRPYNPILKLTTIWHANDNKKIHSHSHKFHDMPIGLHVLNLNLAFHRQQRFVMLHVS